MKYLIRLLIRSCWFYYHREMIKYAEGKICVTRKGQICIIFFWAITHSDKYLYNIKNCWGILWTKLNLQITLRQGYIVSSKTLCFILTLIWGIFQTIYNGIVGLRLNIIYNIFIWQKDMILKKILSMLLQTWRKRHQEGSCKEWAFLFSFMKMQMMVWYDRMFESIREQMLLDQILLLHEAYATNKTLVF